MYIAFPVSPPAHVDGLNICVVTPRCLASTFIVIFFLSNHGSVYGGSVAGEYAYSSHSRIYSVDANNPQINVIWGNEVEGLSASLTSDKTEFYQGEPILLRFQIKNTSQRTQIVPHLGFWPNHKLVVEDGARSELLLTALGLETRAVFGDAIKRRKSFDVMLAPGEVDELYGPFDLRDYFEIGETIILYVRCLYLHGTIEVWSNELVLRIR